VGSNPTYSYGPNRIRITFAIVGSIPTISKEMMVQLVGHNLKNPVSLLSAYFYETDAVEITIQTWRSSVRIPPPLLRGVAQR
jgi:hypothetical protein